MISYKCKECGAEMIVHSNGDIVCPYCGAKENFSDAELREYKRLRWNVLEYLRSCADSDPDPDKTARVWDNASRMTLKSADGEDVVIEYLYEAENDGVKMYCARNSVIYIFPKNMGNPTEKIMNGLALLDYPQADVRNLSKCFPQYNSTIVLDSGETMVALHKPADFYPLSMFGSLSKEHVAWIISRLENICCVFQYSDITHGDIEPDSICINPRTHEAMLFGAWWNVKKRITSSHLFPNKDLTDLRITAKKILGAEHGELPKDFEQFLNEKPRTDAYTDFENWDKVIETAFGGRRFTKMEF